MMESQLYEKRLFRARYRWQVWLLSVLLDVFAALNWQFGLVYKIVTVTVTLWLLLCLRAYADVYGGGIIVQTAFGCRRQIRFVPDMQVWIWRTRFSWNWIPLLNLIGIRLDGGIRYRHSLLFGRTKHLEAVLDRYADRHIWPYLQELYQSGGCVAFGKKLAVQGYYLLYKKQSYDVNRIACVKETFTGRLGFYLFKPNGKQAWWAAFSVPVSQIPNPKLLCRLIGFC